MSNPKPNVSDDEKESPSAEPERIETNERREFLRKSLARAAYVSPVVLLFKPKQAVAGSGGSAITPGA